MKRGRSPLGNLLLGTMPEERARRPRRPIRFGLRSVFVVVTVICVWLGYSMNWIRQRREINCTPLEKHELDKPEGKFFAANFGDEKRLAPGGLWLFGEIGYEAVLYFPPAPRMKLIALGGYILKPKFIFPRSSPPPPDQHTNSPLNAQPRHWHPPPPVG